MKRVVPAVLAFLAAAAAFPAAAQFARAEDAVKYRQSVMYVMNNHMGRLGAMVNGRAPYDARAAIESAEVVQVLSHLPWPAFSANTDKLSRRAKSEIWTEQAKFRELADKLQSDAPKLAAAAKTNNLDNLKAAFGATAQTCKACHDAYRGD